MTDQSMSMLEQRIREKAVRDVMDNVTKSINLTLQSVRKLNPGATMSTTLAQGVEFSEVVAKVRTLVESNAQGIGDLAVKEFHEAYAKLIVEFPDLIEQVKEEAFVEGQQHGQ